jgi:uncharacterized protein YfdQ (DUF2303 family)
MSHQVESHSDRTIESLVWAHDLGLKESSLETVANRTVLVSGDTIHSLEEFESAPYRIKEHRQFADVASFAEYYKTFARGVTKLFGSLKNKSVTAIFDYHGPDAPSWATHKAELVSTVTPEWEAFRAANGKWFSQLEFAEFLEQWNHIVIDPEAAEIIEVALNLSGSTEGRFAAKINRHNGAVSMTYEEDTVTNQVRVPAKIAISCSPFVHSPLVDVLVLLRFRIQEGKPKFQIVIPNAQKVEIDAILAAFVAVGDATDDKVLVGP